MDEWLKVSFKVLECIGVINFIEDIVIPKVKCLLRHIKGEACEDCNAKDRD